MIDISNILEVYTRGPMAIRIINSIGNIYTYLYYIALRLVAIMCVETMLYFNF